MEVLIIKYWTSDTAEEWLSIWVLRTLIRVVRYLDSIVVSKWNIIYRRAQEHPIEEYLTLSYYMVTKTFAWEAGDIDLNPLD